MLVSEISIEGQLEIFSNVADAVLLYVAGVHSLSTGHRSPLHLRLRVKKLHMNLTKIQVCFSVFCEIPFTIHSPC